MKVLREAKSMKRDFIRLFAEDEIERLKEYAEEYAEDNMDQELMETAKSIYRAVSMFERGYITKFDAVQEIKKASDDFLKIVNKW